MAEAQISTLEAAKRLGVSIGWLYQLIRVGEIPATKTGRRWMIPTAAIEARRLAQMSGILPASRENAAHP